MSTLSVWFVLVCKITIGFLNSHASKNILSRTIVFIHFAMVLNIEFPDFPTSLAQAFSAGKFKKVVPEPSPQVLSYKYNSSVADRISFLVSLSILACVRNYELRCLMVPKLLFLPLNKKLCLIGII